MKTKIFCDSADYKVIKYFNNTIHNYTIKENAIFKKYNIRTSIWNYFWIFPNG